MLGPLRVVDGDREVSVPGPKARTLLALLLVRAGEVVPAERLADELWGDALPADAANALQSLVSRLRRGLGDRAAMREPVLEEYVAAGRVPGAARAGEALHRLFTVRDIPALMLNRNAKQHLTVPTLLLGGDRDPVFPPAVLGGGQGHADDLRVEILPGAGHWLPEERPNEVAAAARALFAR